MKVFQSNEPSLDFRVLDLVFNPTVSDPNTKVFQGSRGQS